MSDRSSTGKREDLSGPLAVHLLVEGGCDAALASVVPDEVPAIQRAVSAAITEGADVVFTTGGTGLSPRDVTPQAMDGLLTRDIPGLAEAIRLRGREQGVATAVLSRGRAGIVDVPAEVAVSGPERHVLVVNAPGSPGGVRDAVDVLLPLVRHTLDQLAGGDH